MTDKAPAPPAKRSPSKARRDRAKRLREACALHTARRFLEDSVCECGHVNGEHYTDLSQPHRVAGCGVRRCRCQSFKPVKFAIGLA